MLILCPGDIKSEIKVIEEVVEEFNQQFATTLGISIRTRHWSKSAYAQSGGKPQITRRLLQVSKIRDIYHLRKDLQELFQSVEWLSANYRERLKKALDNSIYSLG